MPFRSLTVGPAIFPTLTPWGLARGFACSSGLSSIDASRHGLEQDVRQAGSSLCMALAAYIWVSADWTIASTLSPDQG